MKIYKNEEGRLIIDGMNHTTIIAEPGYIPFDIDDSIEIGGIFNFKIIYNNSLNEGVKLTL